MTYWFNKFDAITREFNRHFSQLPQPMLSIAPKGEWSIAQHVSHLIKTNESYFPVFDNMLVGTHQNPAMSWCKPLVNLWGNMVYQAVKPTNTKKRKTFSLWEPGETVYTDALWSRLEEHQEKLTNYFNQLSPLVPDKLVLASPANKRIIYSLEKVMMIIPAHELRHLNHALEIKKHLT